MNFAVLFVCTGNVCRSPVAERMFAARLGPASPVTTSSAGLRALTGRPMDEFSAIALREFGIDADHHVARRLDQQLAADADLVLTATAAQRAVITQQNPHIYRRTFTLLEFGRLAHRVDAEWGPVSAADPLPARVDVVANQRGQAVAPDPGADDIDDPFGRSLDTARRTAARIAGGVDDALVALGWPGEPIRG